MTAAVARHAAITRAASSVTAGDTASHPSTGRAPRLVPVPDCEPPLDDPFGGAGQWRPTPSSRTDTAPGPAESSYAPPESPVRVGTALPSQAPTMAAAPAASGARTRMFVRARRDDPSPAPPRPFRVAIISADAVPGWSDDTDIGVTLTPTTALPPARNTGTALVRALLEVLSDCRPVEQLRAHCAPDVFAGLQDAPMLGGRGSTRLLTTQVCEPADGVAELSAVFRCATRVRALALRLQGVDGRWRVTALQIG